MAKYVSEERLKQIAHKTQNSGDTNLLVLSLLNSIISECKEPNSWIPLEEFLKSGFEGKCWVFKIDQEIQFTEYYESIAGHKVFAGHTGSIPHNRIQKVWPIHKPEPPR